MRAKGNRYLKAIDRDRTSRMSERIDPSSPRKDGTAKAMTKNMDANKWTNKNPTIAVPSLVKARLAPVAAAKSRARSVNDWHGSVRSFSWVNPTQLR